MKKTVVCLLMILSAALCGCSRQALGNTAELMKYSWHARRDGGGEISLRFDSGSAELSLTNGGESAEIAGKMLADDTSFVIFDEKLKQNYAFFYVPRGEKLDLTFEGNTIEMEAQR